MSPRPRQSVDGRFVITSSGCWNWIGPTDRNGYGKFGRHCAHRRAWEEFVGPIPEGLELDHLCLNRSCINPAHLEPVTPAENRRRANGVPTRCRRGHEYNEVNTRYYKRGTWSLRECRVCRRERRTEVAA